MALPSRIGTLLLGFLGLFSSVQSAHIPDTAQVRQLLDSCWNQLYTDPQNARQLAGEALIISREGDFPEWTAQSLNRIGVVCWAQAEYDSALHWLNLAHAEYAAIDDAAGMGAVSNNLGITYMALDYYELAMQSLMDAIPAMRNQGPKKLATLCNNLGQVTHAVGDYDASFFYLQYALTLNKSLPDPVDTAMVHHNLALLYKEKGQFATARRYHEKSISGYKAQPNPYGLSYALFNYGGQFALEGDYLKADSLYEEALVVARKIEHSLLVASIWVKKGELGIREEAYASALAAADSADHYLADDHGLKALQSIWEVRSIAWEKLGQFEQALEAKKKTEVLGDSMLNGEKTRQITELTLQYESELKDEQIAHLKERSLARQRQNWLLGILGVIVLIGAVLVVTRQRTVLRREQELKRQIQATAAAREALDQAELKASEAEKERLAADLRHRSKELSQVARGIIRHHELLQTLEKGLQRIRKNVGAELQQEARELSTLGVGQLGAERERKELQLYLEEAEQQFFQVLDERYPQLTARERRLCALIRMGYTSKQIAALFNINPSSVDMGRYRLRKKLDPEMELSLVEFLEEMMREKTEN